MTLFAQKQRLLVDDILVLWLIDVVMLSVYDVIVAKFTRWLLFDRLITLNC